MDRKEQESKTLEQWISDDYPDDDWGKAHIANALAIFAAGNIPMGNGRTVPINGTCEECGHPTNTGNHLCMVCGNIQHEAPEIPIAIMEGSGSHMISVARATAAKDYASKNQADLLQPYKYEKQFGQPGKHVVNPDYAKVYGDPTKVTKSK